MAELTTLESKLGEVTGLAMAAQDLTKKVTTLVKKEKEHGELVGTLQRMGKEAAETQQRCEEVAAGLNGKKAAILRKARETKKEAQEMAKTYLGSDADALDGFEFMTMAEAGEVGHWGVVTEMAKNAKQRDLQALARWAAPIQKWHLDATLKGSLALARSQDPNGAE